MDYCLINVGNDDRLIIFEIKKSSVKKYVEEIWGWNENYQLKNFNEDFIPANFKKIVCNNNIIGFLETNENDRVVNITEIHLIPDFHGKGIGSKIINDIIKKARLNNKIITVGCFKKNIRATSLYLKLGFQKVKETDTHILFEYT